MLDDFKPIIHDCPRDMHAVTIYFLHDWHIGSRQADLRRQNALLQTIMDDQSARVCVIGDMSEYVVPGSKGDIFYQTLPPNEQKYRVADLIKTIHDAGKLLAVVPGNHERNRITRNAGMFPLYDACVLARCGDLYRQHFAVVDIGFGERSKDKKKPQRFVGFITHRAKDQVNYSSSDTVENIDFFAYGHDHQPKDRPRGKMRYDVTRKLLTVRSVEVINCGALLSYGGYAADAAMRPASDKLYKLMLHDDRRVQTMGFYL